jgi:FMN phosphatase YigB (HAD superfamily)
MDEFIPVMVGSMQEFFCGFVPPLLFPAALQAGFRLMLDGGDPRETALETFLRGFAPAAGTDTRLAAAGFKDYYEGPFRDLAHLATPIPGAAGLVRTTREEGLTLSLATNPIFPREAILARVEWAGLDPGDFALITGAETMHHAKPDAGYYREILSLLGAAPGECLMAGNDRHQDLAAGLVGIRTFLVDMGYLTGRDIGVVPDGRGTLADLKAFLCA